MPTDAVVNNMTINIKSCEWSNTKSEIYTANFHVFGRLSACTERFIILHNPHGSRNAVERRSIQLVTTTKYQRNGADSRVKLFTAKVRVCVKRFPEIKRANTFHWVYNPSQKESHIESAAQWRLRTVSTVAYTVCVATRRT